MSVSTDYIFIIADTLISNFFNFFACENNNNHMIGFVLGTGKLLLYSLSNTNFIFFK